jgi:hypothetical protein
MDLFEIVDWYQMQAAGRDIDFAKSIGAELQSLEALAALPSLSEQICVVGGKFLARYQFPFVVIAALSESEIIVLAVANSSLGNVLH